MQSLGIQAKVKEIFVEKREGYLFGTIHFLYCVGQGLPGLVLGPGEWPVPPPNEVLWLPDKPELGCPSCVKLYWDHR